MTNQALKILSFLITLALVSSSFASSDVINDELVSGLQCSKLTVDSIYNSIQSGAFSNTDRQVLTYNDDVHKGVSGYGDCWSLARWQRLVLLLGRGPLSNMPYSPRLISHLIRNTQESVDGASLARFGMTRKIEAPLTHYQVFTLPPLSDTQDDRFNTDTYAKDVTDDGGLSGRTYYGDIHAFQKSQFYRVSNLYYVAKPSTSAGNAASLLKIADLVRLHRLPMVILRMNPFSQHVVLVTDITKIEESRWHMSVIDSNTSSYYPSYLTVARNGDRWNVEFTTWNSSDKVDVFLTGEDERPKIDEALLLYYQGLCKSAKTN